MIYLCILWFLRLSKRIKIKKKVLMIKINTISNNKAWCKYLRNPNTFVERKIYKFNRNYKKNKKNKIFFTLLLSGEKEIKKLNKKFRKKNKTTDILSFPFYNKKKLKKKIEKRKRNLLR